MDVKSVQRYLIGSGSGNRELSQGSMMLILRRLGVVGGAYFADQMT